jgi:hypothetical protein
MRKLGLLLLTTGLLWLLILQLGSSMRAGVRPVVLGQYKQLDLENRNTFTRSEVEERLRETAAAAYDAAPSSFALPGLLMFAGGLLAARRSRPTPISDA